MCLDNITETYKKPKSGTGWKLFEKYKPGIVLFEWQSHNGKREVPTDTWLESSNNLIRHPDKDAVKYPSGFHIYMERPPYSPGYTRRKVRFRGGHTVGMQDGHEVMVARKLFVPRSHHKHVS